MIAEKSGMANDEFSIDDLNRPVAPGRPQHRRKGGGSSSGGAGASAATSGGSATASAGRQRAARTISTAKPDRWGQVTQIAFLLALSLAAARGMMLETIREPFEATPGAMPVPRGASAGASLILDLACCVPALLVLARRAGDRSYRLRWSASCCVLAALCIWMLISARWAGDSFSAIVSAANFSAAAAMLWAMAQLVRSWLRVRTVAAVCFGLLLVYIAYGIKYRLDDLPAMQQELAQNKALIFSQHNWAPDSFEARQFAKNITSGSLIGFNDSPNSYAAVIVLFTLIACGIIAQRWKDGRDRIWPVVFALAIPAAGAIVFYTRCRAAFVTPFLGLMILAALALTGRAWARHARAIFFSVIGFLILCGAALIQHGLAHGTLFHDSLTFRWKYWIGAWRVYWTHPWIGVGWGNFGSHYLAARLPEASEEILDPHNFLVRFFVELGAIGGVIAVSWLARLWWEWTAGAHGLPLESPPAPDAISSPAARKNAGKTGRSSATQFAALPSLTAIIGAAICINALASIDFTQSGAFTIVELLQRLLLGCVMLIGVLVAALRSIENPQIDPRPAPWILWAMLASLGIFLFHNLIEFSLFETGPLMLFAVIGGAALGARLPPNPGQSTATGQAPGSSKPEAKPMTHDRKSGRVVAMVTLSIAVLFVGFVAAVFVAPVVASESQSALGDLDVMGVERPDGSRAPTYESLTRAEMEYQQAFTDCPINGQNAFLCGRAMALRGDTPAEIHAELSAAVAANPMSVEYRLARADLESQTGDPAGAIADYKAAAALDPNNVDTRLRFAKMLANFKYPVSAIEQYQAALDKDALLDPEEPKRMTPNHRQEIESEIDRLRLATSGG
jgi:O-antigen ligase